MNDPRRLLEGAGNELEQRLLRACVHEEPPPGAPARLSAALGLSTPAGEEIAGEATAGDAPDLPDRGAEVAGPSAAPAAGAGLGAGVGWLAGGALVLAGAGALLHAVLAPAAPAEVTPPSLAPRDAPAEVAHERAPEAEPELSGRPQTQRTRSIAREIAALDRARRALHDDDAPAALQALSAYARRHPHGMLRQEAALLRVEALIAAGEEHAAKKQAARFLRDNPDSPHAKRIRAMIGGAYPSR